MAVTEALQTRLAQAGCEVDAETGALTPPIHPSSTFERDANLEYPRGFVYSRAANPTRSLLERVLADIETPVGGIPGEACAFSSGVAAAAAVFQALPNGHVILADDVYHGNRSLLLQVFNEWGLRYTMVDMTNLDMVEKALGNARAEQVRAGRAESESIVVWSETPSNPLLKVTDIRAVASICGPDIPLIVDSTWCTPWICQPLALGADLVVHSSTKYFGGHSDLTGGALIKGNPPVAKRSADALFEKCRLRQAACGGVPSAFDAWLTLRGLRSLSARMDLHSRNALAVAQYLERHPRVERVYYPGLDAHPGKKTMSRQSRVHMSKGEASEEIGEGEGEQLYGGMVSFQVRGGKPAAVQVAASLKTFKRATSLGGTESLVEHRRSVEDDESVTPENLLRLSVGLESKWDLLSDLGNGPESVDIRKRHRRVAGARSILLYCR